MLRHPSARHRLAAALRAPHRLGHSALLGSGALVLSLASLSHCNADRAAGPPPVASLLAFKVDPTSAQAGGTIAPVVVQARDSSGKVVTSYNDSVTLTLAVDPSNATLLGTTTVAAVGGVATFSNLSIKAAATGYRLQAASPSLTPTLSAKFDIIPGPATHLGFTVQPGTSVAGTAIAPAVKVTALDSLQNAATGFAGSITVAISAGTGKSGATLSGITSATASGGVATFTTLKIDSMGTGYRLAASTSGLTQTTSDSFDIVAGAASQLVFLAQPTTTTAGAAIAPPVQVGVRDGVGNPVTGFVGNVTVSITSGSGTSGASLAGTRTVAVSGGVATFSDLSINRSGTGYTLAARSSGLAGTTSTPFDILVGPLSAIVFTAQPKTTTAGATLAPVVVTAQDASGNTVTTFGDAVTLSISANPGNGALHGTTTQAAVNGVATFSDLSIDSVGTGYRLQALAGALVDTSQAFSIRPGGASRLVFTVQPSTTTAGAAVSPAVQVSEIDSLGNTVTTFTGAVTVGITPGSGTAGASLSGVTTVTAISGVASFSTLSIDSAGTGYTLTASTDGLADTTSAAFSIVPGQAARLDFTVQPTTAIAGDPISPPVQVTARDAIGNVATSFTANVTVAITTGTGTTGANLAGTKTEPASAGVATFPDLSIDLAGTGYTLSARSSGIVGTVSTPFDILIGSVTQLVFTQQPTTDTAGRALSPAVQITAEDGAGNTVTGFTGSVTMSIAVNPGGGTLSGTKSVNAIAGVATFSDLSIDKAGTGYRLQAAVGSLKDTSQAFSIIAGTATKLAFTVQPTSTTTGTSISPAVKVAGQDAFGNLSTGFTGNVTVAIGTNPSGGSLSGTLTLAATSGVATFSNLSIDKAGTGYTLKATSSGLTSATSASFNINTGAATQLVFTVQPATTTAGATITPSVKVTAEDASGNTVTAYTGTVTMAIGTDAGNGTLSGTKNVTAVSGVATFSDLSINHTGTGYTLKASATGLTTAISAPFNILPGAAAVLVFTTQPATTTATATLAPVVVTAQDAQGNTATGFTGKVTMSIAVNPGGGTLSGSLGVNASAGVATFSTLSIDKAGTGYRLAASTSGLVPDTSSAFSITPGPATTLAFTVPPSNTGAGAVITPAVKVSALDAGGNVATAFTGQVTVAIGTNPSGGTLSGTKTQTAVSGVATFNDLSIDKLGTGYTLKATTTGLTSATSPTFNIVVGTATQLIFTVQPSNATAGTVITPAIKVTAQDGAGNTATSFTGNVTIGIGTNPGGGSLSGTKTVAAVSGVATFADLSINKPGTGYTLTASASGLTGGTSAAFNIAPGPISALVFTVQPTTTTATTIIAPAVQVTARDSLGNTVSSFTGNVTMSIAVNPGGGSLSGTATVAAASGVATFSNLSIDKVGTGYRLQAAAGAVTATSQAFSILPGTAKSLAFTVQPSTTGAGSVISPPVEVTALDAGGNVATGFTGNVLMAIGTNPGGGTLSGTLTQTAVAGVATFSDLSINKLGTGYTLKATSSGLTTATSATFNIVTGTATQLAFTTQPTNSTAGATMTVKVTARDAQGNTATGYTGNVTLAIGTNPGGGTLSGATTVAAVSGVATFSVSINKSGTGYTLTASASGLTGATSSSFNITAGALTQVGFTVQPTSTTAGATITPTVKVAGQDAFGNTVTSFSGSVTIAITAGTGTAGATLSGTLTVNASSGVATFSDLSIDKAGLDYHLTATSGSLTSATSTIFAITAGAATHLSFDQQPTTTAAGSTITPAVAVSARDAFNNLVKTFSGNITVAITSGTGAAGAILSGTPTQTAVSGVASFGNLSINLAGTAYQLSATASGLTGATSSTFNIN